MTKYKVSLTSEERAGLERLVSVGKTAARKLTHARILLLADTAGAEKTDEEIAAVLAVSLPTIGRVRQRFVSEGLEAALNHRPQPARPDKIKIKGGVEQELIRLACSDPPEGRCRWTLCLLADELVALGLVASVSPETVRQALKKNNHPLYCWGLRFEGKDDHGKLWPVRGLARRQAMARRSPQGMDVATVVFEPVEPLCGECRRQMGVRTPRLRRIYSLAGPLLLDCKLMHCPHAACPNHRGTFSPEQELTLAMPRWLIGWDVFCWLGHRRFARHWSVPQLRAELWDSYAIELSEDALEDYLQRYQCMLAARQQNFALLKEAYATTRQVVLSIDGLQPEKGHETLYVVRELGRQRVWFAKPLLSSATNEIRPLIVQAKEWAERLGCRIRLWMSDKQDAFVTAIAR